MKQELVKALLFACLGAMLALKLAPKPASPAPQVITKAENKCEASVAKTTHKDGSITEVVQVSSDVGVENKLNPLPELQHIGLATALFTDKSAYIRYEVNSAFSVIGKIDKVDSLDSNKAIGIEFRF